MPRGPCRRLAPALALLLLACGGGGTGEAPVPVVPPGTARLSGRILFSEGGEPGAPILEAEPNDSPETAHRLGALRPGETLVVHGHTTALDDSDPFDGFQIEAPERVRVTATLVFPDGGGNDFDMGVFDLVSMRFVETFLAVTAPEVGTFHAKGSFDVVVTAYAGEGDYVLTIAADPIAGAIPEREPNDAGTLAQYLGEVADGDVVTVTGSADEGLDARDGVLVSCPVSCEVSSSLAFPAGDDFDVRVYDATDDPGFPTLLAAYESATNNPEVGAITVGGGTLLYVEVIAYAGGGTWTLSLTTQSLSGASAKPLPPARAPAPLAGERSPGKERLGRGPYGRPRVALVPGEVLVGYEPDADADLARAAVAKRGGRTPARRGLPFDRVAVEVPAGLDAVEAARFTLARTAALRSAAGVRYAEPDYVCRAHAQPDDPHYNLQWHYELLHLEEAWDVTVGSSDVIVAVIDTGRRDHPDLESRQGGGYDFISSPSNAGDGDGMDPDPTDEGDASNPDGTSSFHGTHVAGTIGAATDNGLGVAGVTWLGVVMHLRALGRQGGTVADIADALRYAARLPNASGSLPSRRANVVNMSLGGAGFTQTMQDAVNAARAAGVVIFASAGNEASSVPSYPAAHDGVISVAAVDLNGNPAPYSNFGATIDLAAPGGDMSVDRDGDGYPDGVLSTLYDDGTTPARAVYGFYAGTSMACPHAAGVAALMLAVNPTLTPEEVEAILEATADDRGAAGRDDRYGYGLIDAHAAVLAAQGGAVADPVLLVSPTSLNFGGVTTRLVATVSNGGGGSLTVTSLGTATQDGAPWLSASFAGPGDETRNVAGIQVEVDRAGLADGSYAGRVTVHSDGGTALLQALMTVGTGTPLPPDVDVYVLAVDAATGETVEQVVVNPQTGLDYVFPELPPGVYVLAAGTDLDDDGEICDEGELCGMYPVAGEPVPLVLAGGSVRTGVDFVVAPDDAIGSQAAAPEACGCTFRRLR